MVLKITLVFENYATFYLSVLYKKKKETNEVQIIYFSSIKHEIFFILKKILWQNKI